MNKMYEEVFQDIVRCYLDNMEEEDKTKLSDDDIKNIAYKMIYKNEYIWEKINETVDMYIGNIILEKEDN